MVDKQIVAANLSILAGKEPDQKSALKKTFDSLDKQHSTLEKKVHDDVLKATKKSTGYKEKPMDEGYKRSMWEDHEAHNSQTHPDAFKLNQLAKERAKAKVALRRDG